MGFKKMFINKKGDMPWWLTRLIIPLAILVFIAFIIYAVRKEINLNILNIFKGW